MRKVITIAALFATTLVASAQDKPVTEIAIYEISDTQNQRFPELLLDFRQQVSKLEGFETYITLRDIHSPNIYIDVLHWSDINTAIAASESVKYGETYKAFTSAIDSLIAYGEFYSFKSFTHKNSKINMDNKITEVVIYQLKADAVSAYSNIADVTNKFLENQEGFISRKILQDHKDKSIFMDIVEWDSLANAETAMQQSQKEPSLLPFFEATEKVITFSHYTFFK